MTAQAPSKDAVDVSLEVGTKRVFAGALEWPGWCRSGKAEEQALDALAVYAARYAVVAREAGVTFRPPRRRRSRSRSAYRGP